MAPAPPSHDPPRSAMATGADVAAHTVKLLREVTYVTVGLGLLGFQRAQVRRRELERSLRPPTR